jgi:hypothetical protein
MFAFIVTFPVTVISRGEAPVVGTILTGFDTTSVVHGTGPPADTNEASVHACEKTF